MFDIRSPIEINKAIDLVMARINRLKTLSIPVQDSYGFILAEPIVAKHDVPPFNRSSYDGFAIRSKDSALANHQNKVVFKIVDRIGAGQVSEVALKENEAVRIMTGAPIPENADAVVMLEQSSVKLDTLTITRTFNKMENISLQGDDAKKDAELILMGSFINPGTIALMATFGYTHIRVSRKPVVGVLSTGNELLQVKDQLQPGKIRDSNGPMIISQLKRMGAEPRSYGITGDDFESCYNTIKRAINETDCLITTGGVSVGDFDFLPEVYQKIDAEVLFNKVAIRPGSVTTVATVKNKMLFGLPGNPSSCYTAFELLVRPALFQMMGNVNCYLPQTKAILMEDFKMPNQFTRFIRAHCSFDGTNLVVSPTGFNGSHAVTAIALGNSFIVLQKERKYQIGDEVDVLLLGAESGLKECFL